MQTLYLYNFYFKKLIPNEDYIKLESFLDFNKQYFNKFSYDTNGLTPSDIWINKLTPESNLNDPLHRDVNELSTVTFLNSNFEGGELEIEVDNSIQLLRPKQGKSLIFEGNKIRHRALPVISGERYTMVVFWKLPVKNQKTLL